MPSLAIRTLALLSLVVALAASPLRAAAAAVHADGTLSAPEIERAVLAANDAMVSAANRLDLDAFFGAMLDADHAMIVQNGAIFQTRSEARAAVERALRGVKSVDRRFDDPQVTVISPDTALLVSEGSVTATFEDGRQMVGCFAVSLVFVLRDGQWKLLHGHYSAPVSRP